MNKKEKAFLKAINMLEEFAEENNLCIMGTMVLDDPDGDCYIEQINTNMGED